jgi:hypothetical protein
MTRLLIIGTLAALAGAQSEAPPDPITDRLRFEIAKAQRDYVIAKQQYDAATERLRKKTAEAETACAADGKAYAAEAFRCVEKPAQNAPPQKQ